MGQLILQMGISIDGFVSRTGGLGSSRWGSPPEDAALKQRKLELIRHADAHLMGRTTYEEMSSFWPTSDDEYAEPMNTIPKVVFSTTLERADWPETRIARGDLSEEIARVKEESAGYVIAWGGPTFARSLVGLGLVDEYRLVHHPVALGEGLPLFNGLTSPVAFRPIETTAYDSGLTLFVYRPASG